MRVLRSVEGHVPRVAEEIGKLNHEGKRAVSRVFPEGLVKSGGEFLGGAVLAVGRSGVAVANQRIIRIQRDVAADIDAAIVAVNLRIVLQKLALA